jgi:S-adenosylmethionine hydrolase
VSVSPARVGIGLLALLALHAPVTVAAQNGAPAPAAAMVFQTDFGTEDGAVAEMKGVAYGVSPSLRMFDVTHQIPPFDIWVAAWRLKQVAPYWPRGTVFVSVVDPGVGTSRKSVVMRSRSGHYFVSPDNGTLTLVAEELGIDAVREIDERRNRYPGSEASFTFHGRDVYAYTGARLASGTITFEQVGPLLVTRVVSIPYQHVIAKNGMVSGAIPILDLPYGNVWTNIDWGSFGRLRVHYGDVFTVRIFRGGDPVWTGDVPFVRTFGDVPLGKPLLYRNSVSDMALALNQGNFARTYGVSSGANWRVEIRKR